MLEFAASTNFVPKATVSGVFFTSTSATIYLKLYVFSLFDASLTVTDASCSPNVNASPVGTILFSVIWSPVLLAKFPVLEKVPVGKPVALSEVIGFALSVTSNVGSNFAPRNTINLGFSVLFSLSSTPCNFTFGASLSDLSTFTLTTSLVPSG